MKFLAIALVTIALQTGPLLSGKVPRGLPTESVSDPVSFM